MLKISDEDRALLYPGRSIDDFARSVLAAGTPLVVVTRGSDGAIGFSHRDSVEMAPEPVTVVDTVGAGDTFQAALLTWLAKNERLSLSKIDSLDASELKSALAFAARAAAITCGRRGANLPRRAELG